MALIRRPESPYYHVEVEFKGRRYRRSSKTKNRRDAENFERLFRQRVYEQVMLGMSGPVFMTLNAAVERYKKGHLLAVIRRPKTARTLDYLLDRLTRLVGADTPLHEITIAVIADLKERLLKQGAKPATVNRYLSNLRAVLRIAHYEWGVLDKVPRIRLFTLRNERTRWLTLNEEHCLLTACAPAPHLRDLVIFLLDTGTRLGEALDLEWRHVYLPDQGCGTFLVAQSKSGRPREMPLTQRADALLRELKAKRPIDTERAFLMRLPGCAWRGTMPRAVPFSNPHGSWRSAVKRAGLNDVRMHDLRHTFASRLVQRDIPLHTVSRLLGHESLKMTLRYSHLAIADLKRAVRSLDRVDSSLQIEGSVA